MDSEQITLIKKDLRERGYNLYVYSYPAGMVFPPTAHAYAKIHIVLSGSIRITLNDEIHELKSGDRLMVPAHQPHSAEVLGEMPVVCIDATKYEAE